MTSVEPGVLDATVRRHAVEGAGVFDLQIVATMLANGVQRIYTFDPGDFKSLRN